MSYYDTDIWEDVELTTENNVFPAYFFNKCGVTDIVMPENTVKIGKYAMGSCSLITEMTIPSTVAEIGNQAFGGSGLTQVTVPGSVTKIGSYAFWGCANLVYIELPENLTELPEGLLQQTALEDFTLGPNVTKIGANTFKDCQQMIEINGLDNVTEIGRYAFNNCYQLKNIAFGDALTEIGAEAFTNCIRLKDVTIPASVEYIGNLAFAHCQEMEAIDVEPGNTAYKSIDGILYTADGLTAVASPAGKSGTIAIPEGVTTIGANCFEINIKVTEVELPSTVTKVDNEAFKFCTALERLKCDAVTPPALGWRDVFLSVPVDKCVLQVPDGSVNDYRAAEGWKDFMDINSGVGQVFSESAEDSVLYGIDGVRRSGDAKGMLIMKAPGRKARKVFRK